MKDEFGRDGANVKGYMAVGARVGDEGINKNEEKR